VRNLEIGAQSPDSKNAQRNLEIAQIPKLRGTYMLLCSLIYISCLVATSSWQILLVPVTTDSGAASVVHIIDAHILPLPNHERLGYVLHVCLLLVNTLPARLPPVAGKHLHCLISH